MITNKYGIHTFSLKLQCKYSEIQNIIEQNECICTGKGKLGLSPYYQMPQFKSIGVEIHLGQSISHPCWLILIVNPSSLLASTYEPTALFQSDEKSVQQLKHHLRNILDKIGVDRRLKEFKLSRCDLTCNLYYDRKADVQDRFGSCSRIFSASTHPDKVFFRAVEYNLILWKMKSLADIFSPMFQIGNLSCRQRCAMPRDWRCFIGAVNRNNQTGT